ncbi:malonyl-ACP O-methyltransferase BioC [Simiduia aestuariiviva]|uniref:Malonyl-[acyl-carrier protein] O-methyltransferase n=1 Tax=Simiduia aestuariiviva TaxID=1510459 RepID=A0A839UG52_9GAMM|nr:malonyl-CoA O-methyltransferase [Simiduia aestuariiviva]
MSQRDKLAVAQSFSKAAQSYDSVAALQRSVGSELLAWLQDLGAPNLVADLGSGTGFFTEQLQQKFPNAHTVGLDIAPGMLQFARAHRQENVHWLGGDMENLPLRAECVDVFFSSLAVQWCENLPQFFAEIFRCLAPGGYLALATLGPETLFELRDSWRAVDEYTHVNQFDAEVHVTEAAQRAGLAIARWQAAPRVMHYSSLRELTHELKALGAHNVNYQRAPGLTGRQKIKQLRDAYEGFRTPQGLPASYQVYWMLVQKPARA